MTIRLLAGAVLMLTPTAALADTAGPAPKPLTASGAIASLHISGANATESLVIPTSFRTFVSVNFWARAMY